jgi:phytoene synthase
VNVATRDAYAACDAIARREAKNFYYAFRVLPRGKRLAMSAVYAFMRHADDLSDDESIPQSERLARTEAWLAAWHRAAGGEQTADPIFLAMRDVRQRFRIPLALLDQLVEGTLMDVSGAPVTYETFGDLYHYCYLVASVVGLVCIRIFGYSDPRAEALAEQTGIAFQLTNILRDVREDAARGRIYLPSEDLASHGVTADQLAGGISGRTITLNEFALFEMEARRALDYYAAADELLPLIDADSRAALWVLVRIYRRLLQRIIAARYEVYRRRVRVSTFQKLGILLRGLLMALRLRLFAARSTRHEDSNHSAETL